MDPLSPNLDAPSSFRSILVTDELARRPCRPADHDGENRAFAQLARSMSQSPQCLLQTLTEVVVAVCRAESAGISMLEEEQGEERVRWQALAGRFPSNISGLMARA